MTLPLQIKENLIQKMPVSLSYKLVKAEQVREHELAAAATQNYSSFDLMQRAGVALMNCIAHYYGDLNTLLVVVGWGNNAGDGYVVATLAKKKGFEVTVASADPSRKLSGDANRAQQQWCQSGGSIIACHDIEFSQFDLLVDALLGTGLQDEVRPLMHDVIEKINQSKVPVVSVDLPSGMQADTGSPQPISVVAQHTVTFVAIKPGLVTGIGKHYCGHLLLDDLSIELAFHQLANTKAELISWPNLAKLAERENHANKGKFGHLLCIGGNQGMAGAITLSAQAALRCGAGLVKVYCHENSQLLVGTQRSEIMLNHITGISAINEALEWSSCIVFGPGLGSDAWAHSQFSHVMAYLAQKAAGILIDADGLNLLAKCWSTDSDINLGNNSVLTPHPGEAARLLGTTVAEIERDRYASCQAIASRYQAVCVLKGAGTVICSPDKSIKPRVCADGNPGMATAGMGDVLSGVIGGLLAQGLSALDAATYGVCLHASAGDRVATEYGQRGMMASDLFEPLRTLVNYR